MRRLWPADTNLAVQSPIFGGGDWEYGTKLPSPFSLGLLGAVHGRTVERRCGIREAARNGARRLLFLGEEGLLRGEDQALGAACRPPRIVQRQAAGLGSIPVAPYLGLTTPSGDATRIYICLLVYILGSVLTVWIFTFSDVRNTIKIILALQVPNRIGITCRT